MLMLKTTMSSHTFAANEVLGAKMFAASKFGDAERCGRSKCVKPKTRKSENQKLAKSEKSSKSGRSESQKLAKSRKLSNSKKSKSEKLKKLSKNRNFSNFEITEAKSSFLTLDARTAFNHLWLS